MTRDDRQSLFIDIFRKKKGVGTLLAATGFGKTYTSLLIIQKFIKKNSNTKVLIVVPTENLKNQWMYKIKQMKLHKYCEVQIINTACKYTEYYDLLILDEIHMYGGKVFSKIFTVPHSFILGLTASIDPYSTIKQLIDRYCPVIDEISMEECSKYGWIAEFEVYNLGVSLTDDEKIAYNKAEWAFRHAESQLGGRFKAFETSKQWKESDDVEKKKVAFLYWSSMQKRRKILLNSANKIEMAIKIADRFKDKKTLIFSETITVANQIKKNLGERCLLYHSKLPEHEKAKSLRLFSESDKITSISSVKALNAGQDMPECSLGIVIAGNSKAIDDIQRTGRIVRKYGDKRSIFINLFIPNTQDEVWLNNRQSTVIPKMIYFSEEIPNF